MNLRNVFLAALMLGAVTFAGATDTTTTPTKALQRQLSDIAAEALGNMGVSVIHVESGNSVSLNADEPTPMYSTFKLPLAVVVMKLVESGKLHLDQKVSITTADVAPGMEANSARWKDVPVQKSISELLELSLIHSDNTSSDKLLELVGGPATLTSKLGGLGVGGIEIKATIREIFNLAGHPNRASAKAVTALLVQLQKGNVLKPGEREILFKYLESSRTGAKRLRGSLPEGVRVLDKTGTGPNGAATNDVGIIELPGDRGHIAVSVYISNSTLEPAKQELLISRIGSAAYDAFSK